MTIVETNQKHVVPFGELIGGAFFKDAGEYYLVTEEINCRNAVNVRTGEMVGYDDDAAIEILPNAKIVV